MNYLAAAVILCVALTAYYNSFPGAFIFDDDTAIVQNSSIRQLWPLSGPLNPPITSGGITVVGRPVLNFSFAVNYAVSGLNTWSYHLFNGVIHALAALLLFGMVRRTLLTPVLYRRFGPAAGSLGLAAALLWLVHPLQTDSVTYIVQRAESLAGMLYLLTMYCFIRGTGSPTPLKWYSGAVAACFLGVACKEVLASAPLMALLYDRTFVSGTFREAWRRRQRLYILLASSWLVLAWLVAAAHGPRAGAAGYQYVSPFVYALTQCKAIVLYLKLSLWPHPLVIDYGENVVKNFSGVLWQCPVVLLLLTGTVIALRRSPVLGFLGAWFFLILGPSSSFMPIASQTMAEHRMYLPLAAIIVLGAAALYWLFEKRLWTAVVPLVALMGWMTIQRNSDYSSELSMWTMTAARCPSNARAHHNLGYSLWKTGDFTQAIKEYKTALKLLPDYPQAHCNLGWVLSGTGRSSEAIAHYQEALRLNPDYYDAHTNLGIELINLGRTQEALIHFEQAVKKQPYNAKARSNLGSALAMAGRLPEAVQQFREVLRIDPANMKAQKDLETALNLLQGKQ